MHPGHPLELEFVKTDVYISAHVVAEMPGAKVALAEIIQKWSESVGLPTIRRWDRAFKKAGIDFRDKPTEPAPVMSIQRPFLPQPSDGTCHYVCYGRAIGELDDMIWNTRSARETDRGGPARRGYKDSNGEDDPLALRRRIRELEMIIEHKDGQIEQLQERISEISYGMRLLYPLVAPC